MIDKNWNHSLTTKSGLKLTAYIGPYVWMYHSGHIDAIIVQDEQGCELRPACSFDMSNNSEADLNKFLDSYTFPESKCLKCGATMLAHASKYRTNDECDRCCKVRIIAEYEEETKGEREQEAAEDKAMLKKGFTHKIVAWVHPKRGDDRQIVAFAKEKPTNAAITKMLKRAKSQVLDDYIVEELKEA